MKHLNESDLNKVQGGLIPNITGQAEFNNFTNNNGLNIVIFGAEWCPPCKRAEEALKTCTDLNIAKIDCDTNNEIAENFGIKVIPTFFIYKNGKQTHTITGFSNLDAFKKNLIF